MRLEHDNDPSIDAGTRGSDDRRDLGGMVSVVVDHHHAVLFASLLESAIGAAEFLQRRSDALERHASLESYGDGAESVQKVVPARHPEPQTSQLRRCTICGVLGNITRGAK